MNNISFYFQHGASISVESNGVYYIFELERITRIRYFDIRTIPVNDAIKLIESALDIFKKFYGIENNFDVCIFPGHSPNYYKKISPMVEQIKKLINAKKIITINHHLAHAACSVYQSPFDQGIAISFDGAGNDGCFNIYRYDKNIKNISNIQRLSVLSFGKCYRRVSLVLKDIEKTKNGVRKPLVGLAGKLMGLVGYGDIKKEWISGFEYLYRTGEVTQLNAVTGLTFRSDEQFKFYFDNNLDYLQYDGKIAYDLAATNQHVFESEFFRLIDSYIDKDTSIVLSGGCALNVLLNEQVRLRYGNRVFIPPNSDDSGISLGQLFIANPPDTQVDVTYSGLPILDLEHKDELINSFQSKPMDILEVASLLKSGNIIGVLRGNSEVGPRALGNRSMLCDPSFLGMKDKLNKIKNREWFRPFAPIVKFEDREKYFNFDYDSRFMSFSPTVKVDAINLFPSIAHVDGTARVQTVTQQQNDFLYNLLDKIGGPLINTSLNINGEPMITSIEQGLYILNSTSLDYLIVDDIIIKNKNR